MAEASRNAQLTASASPCSCGSIARKKHHGKLTALATDTLRRDQCSGLAGAETN